jgi:phosphate-selective porin OprO/OprP
MLHGAIAYPNYKAQYTPQPTFKEFLGYEVGVFNGVRDGQAVQDSDKDTDNNKEIAARVFAHPFMHSDSVLKGLGLGVSGTWGQPKNNALPSLVSDGQQKILTYNTGVVATGDSYRIYPQMYWYWKGLGMMGEYLISSQQLQNGAVNARQENSAWNVNVSYVLTGEENSFFGIKPEHAFDPSAGTWGAWQVAARWSELDIDNSTFANGFANLSSSVSKAQSWALGINWILNDNLKIMTNYEQTLFLGGAVNGTGGIISRPLERALFTRFQIAF